MSANDLLGGAVPHVVRVPIPAEGEPTLPLRVAAWTRVPRRPPAPTGRGRVPFVAARAKMSGAFLANLSKKASQKA